MNARRGFHPGQAGTQPAECPRGGGSIGAALPKLVAIVVAMVVVRNVLTATRRHGGASHRSRRHEAIAQFHRQLHAQDAGAPSAATPDEGEDVTA